MRIVPIIIVIIKLFNQYLNGILKWNKITIVTLSCFKSVYEFLLLIESNHLIGILL